ncbi:carbohydrate ABC transporter permease [Actinoplanes teichomyceticus]|uniref:N-acetylglucosamine transport system permease protein n=1 Tax=Actinoplanes teichomyceticus TaxID=1867 RepID=A0A561VR15_ACTTI|nr:sugar ABC transporter permease [Actinoplanes teichomyceticus]TWG14041.1 N-acetylglucosamine transport system permease protein [Actinoplanes teichomyceticus]GIF16775.1 sugar ABC transporter permease [Actinoplanes teichomyceticus]
MGHGRWRFLFAALVPALVLHVVFVLSPYAQAFYLSLTDWTGVAGQAHFVGVDNYARLGVDPLFLDAVRNNAIMLLVVPAATIGLGLFLASMLHRGGRGLRGGSAYQIVYFFPQLLSLVIVAVLWGFVYNPNTGLLNSGLRAIGLGALAHSWLAEPRFALAAVMAVLVWSSVGFYVVLFRAAIDGIPGELFEAARLDGAGGWSSFRHVTLPLVRENVQVAFVYLGIAALDGFAVVQVMTVGPGGPDGATEVVGLSLYRTAFSYGKFGYASAMGVALFFATLTLAILALRTGRRERPATRGGQA